MCSLRDKDKFCVYVLNYFIRKNMCLKVSLRRKLVSNNGLMGLKHD